VYCSIGVLLALLKGGAGIVLVQTDAGNTGFLLTIFIGGTEN
jgi:hypothetical protein